MAIQLLNFPYLVQRQILKQMDYVDVFFLSLLSKKSIKLVQSVRWREIELFNYTILKEKIIFYIANGQNEMSEFLRIYSKKSEKESPKINVSGRELVYGMPTEKHPHVFYSNEDVGYQVVGELVYDHLNVIFGSHIEYILFHRLSAEQFVLPKRIPFCQTTVFNFDVIQTNLYEEYFDAIPVQEYIKLITSYRMKGQFRRDSKFYDARILHVSSTGARHVLENFRGKCAHLMHAECNDKDVIDFLKRWKSKDSFENLKSFHVEESFFEDLNIEKIKKEAEIKELPESIRPKSIELPDMRVLDVYNHNTVHNSSLYIVRDDGIVGLVVVTPKRLILKVTKYTEEKMLRKA